MNYLREIHFINLITQGNIYNCTKLELRNENNKYLLSNLEGTQILLVEYNRNGENFTVPVTKPISFNFIPYELDCVISMTAFNDSNTSEDDVRVFIATQKDDKFFVNLFTNDLLKCNKASIEKTCQQIIEIPYMPFHMINVKVYRSFVHSECSESDTDVESVIEKPENLSDVEEENADKLDRDLSSLEINETSRGFGVEQEKVDVEVKDGDAQERPIRKLNFDFKFKEDTDDEFYFSHHRGSNVSGSQVKLSPETVVLIAGDDKKVHLYKEMGDGYGYVESPLDDYFIEIPKNPGTVLYMDIKYTPDNTKRLTALATEQGYVYLGILNLITDQVSTFRSFKANPMCYVQLFRHANDHNFQLLVVNTCYNCTVFSQVERHGFTRARKIVVDEPLHWTITAGCVADLDLDGVCEIIIGTFTGDLICFKYNEKDDEWQRSSVKKLSGAIHSIEHFDLTSDGCRELIVRTTTALHIYQHNLKEVVQIIKQRCNLVKR